MKYNFVVIEGNIGAGKTTVVEKLAPILEARPLFEEFTDNPFLPLFYKDPKRYGFALETAFLADRYHQLQDLVVQDLFQPQILADYSIYKSWIFARQNLKHQELKLYKNLFDIIADKLPKPDIIIYMNRSLEGLRQNILTRNRSYEQKIPDSYLLDIQKSYINFFKQVEHIPVVFLDVDSYDFLYKAVDLDIFQSILDVNFRPGINFLK
jgi:deoxyguanosine kinase